MDSMAWKKIVEILPRQQFVEWMRELHGDGFHSEQWLSEEYWNGDLPYLSFLDGTLVCRLDLSDPPAWVVMKALELVGTQVDQLFAALERVTTHLGDTLDFTCGPEKKRQCDEYEEGRRVLRDTKVWYGIGAK